MRSFSGWQGGDYRLARNRVNEAALGPATASTILFPGAYFAADFGRNYARLANATTDIDSIKNWSFSRASQAYALNRAGTLLSFASGSPRITDRGLLVEGARTNLLLQSRTLQATHQITVTSPSGAFTNGETVTATGGGSGVYISASSSAWLAVLSGGAGTFTGTLTGGTSGTTATISSALLIWSVGNAVFVGDQAIAADGTLIADKLRDGAAGLGSVQHAKGQTIAANNTLTHTLSIYAKAAERSTLRLLFDKDGAFTDRIHCDFDLAAGTKGTVTTAGAASAAVANIEALANGWYRCQIQGIPNSGAAGTSLRCLAYLVNATSYVGDGASGIYAHDFQLEAAAGASSPIVTTTASATRAADVAAITGLSIPYPATIFVKAERAVDTGALQTLMQIDAASDSDRAALNISTTDTGRLFTVSTAGGGTMSDILVGTMNTGDTRKLAAYISTNDINVAMTGALGTQDVSSTNPATATALRLGTNAAGVAPAFSYIQQIAIYANQSRGASGIQALTA